MLLTGDPLDNRYLYLKPSKEYPLAGEGAHAKIDVPAFTPFSLYGGHIMTQRELGERKNKQVEDLKARGLSMRDPEGYDTWKYRHNIGHCGLGIDIPIEYGDTNKFRATLGHKINHKFNPTTFYTQIDSARYVCRVTHGLLPPSDLNKLNNFFPDLASSTFCGPEQR